MTATDLRAHPPGAREIMALTWPLYLELWLTVAVGWVAVGLAARESAAATAGLALAQQVAAMLFVLFRIVGAGVSVAVSQRLGHGQVQGANDVARASLGATTCLGGLTALPALLWPEGLLRGMGAGPEVVAVGAPVLLALAPALLLDAWNASMASVLRARLRPRDALMVIVAIQMLALLLTPLLVRGFGTWGGLGLVGYAYALLVARAVGLVAHLAMWRWRLDLHVRFADFWRWRPQEMRAVLRVGLPGAAENIAWRSCFVFTVALAAQMGTQAVATHALVLQIQHGILLFSYAIGVATEIVVGHLIGQGALHRARGLVRRSVAWGLLISSALALVAALLGSHLMRLFTQDTTVIALGSVLLWCSVLVESGRVFNLIVINGLRAAGDTLFPFHAGVFCMVFVMGGGAWLLGVGLGWGLVGLWLSYAADEWIRGIVMWWRWQRLGWLGGARRVHRELRAAGRP